MNIDDKKSFQSFTNHLIDDFQDYLPFTPLCKLHVIDCYLQDMTNNDITNSLANFAEKIKNNKKNIHITKRSTKEIDKDDKSLIMYLSIMYLLSNKRRILLVIYWFYILSLLILKSIGI